MTKEKARQKKITNTDPDDMKTPAELAKEAAAYSQAATSSKPAPTPAPKGQLLRPRMGATKAKAKPTPRPNGAAIDKGKARQAKRKR